MFRQPLTYWANFSLVDELSRRQTLREFAAPGDFKVYVADSASSWRTFALAELLPESFGPETLKPPQT